MLPLALASPTQTHNAVNYHHYDYDDQNALSLGRWWFMHHQACHYHIMCTNVCVCMSKHYVHYLYVSGHGHESNALHRRISVKSSELLSFAQYCGVSRVLPTKTAENACTWVTTYVCVCNMRDLDPQILHARLRVLFKQPCEAAHLCTDHHQHHRHSHADTHTAPI